MIDKVLKNLKIVALNEMQLASLKALKNGGNVVLLSPTGSGKTLGFLLPILEKLKPEENHVQALIIAPSRELAIQIEQVFKMMGTGFKANCCYGGHPMKIEKNNLEHAPAVLIGTPGRILAHLKAGNFKTDSIETLVLDEFDKALELGYQRDLSSIIDHLQNLKSRILTSATKADEIPAFTGIKSAVELNFLSNTPSQNLTLKVVISDGKDKLQALFSLICKLGNKPTLIFCNHRDAVERISNLLWEKDIIHGVFHGGLEQEDRERALIKFRNGSFRMLITTDLASRGLDIPEIENVIHYQLPPTEIAFIHRNGRTARMHAQGTSFIVLAENEEKPPYLNELPNIEELPTKNVVPENSQWETLYIASGKKDKINKIDIVGLLLQKGKLKKEELGLIEVLDYSSFAAVSRNKINQVVALIKNEKIKKKMVKMEIAR